jgi:hypothetical protein
MFSFNKSGLSGDLSAISINNSSHDLGTPDWRKSFSSRGNLSFNEFAHEKINFVWSQAKLM